MGGVSLMFSDVFPTAEELDVLKSFLSVTFRLILEKASPELEATVGANASAQTQTNQQILLASS